ncbi:MAG TPA: transcriptional repressor [Thermoanaerobaculia bacterium]|nr:transcriptional repressor [Thermoanaerobaculia bacterium]
MASFRERERFLSFLRRRRQRVTAERLVLLDEMFAQHGHIDAEELWRAIRARGLKISRATVYRNLELLVASGLARKQRLGRRRFLYEHLHAGQRHDHLVCARCRRVVEFVSPGIAALQVEICRAHGFVPGASSLQISGLCRPCAAEAAAVAGAEAATASEVAAAPESPDSSGSSEPGAAARLRAAAPRWTHV